MFYHVNGGYMNKIAKISTTAAIIAGLGIISVSPIAAHADDSNAIDTNQEQQISIQNEANDNAQINVQANSNNENESEFTVKMKDGTKRTFKYDGTHTTITCLSSSEPTEVSLFTHRGETSSLAQIISAYDTSTTIDGRTISGKKYTAKAYNDEQITLQWFKASDFFANVKVTINGIAAEFNPDSDDKQVKTTDSFKSPVGEAIVHQTMEDNDAFKEQFYQHAKISIEGIPAGWSHDGTNNADEIGPADSANDATHTYKTFYYYTNPEYPDNIYVLTVTVINEPPQSQQTPEQTSTAPELVQTSIEQTTAATVTILATGTAVYSIIRKRTK